MPGHHHAALTPRGPPPPCLPLRRGGRDRPDLRLEAGAGRSPGGAQPSPVRELCWPRSTSSTAWRRSGEEIDSGWRSAAWRRSDEEAAARASPASARAPRTPPGRSCARHRPLARGRSIQRLAAATEGRRTGLTAAAGGARSSSRPPKGLAGAGSGVCRHTTLRPPPNLGAGVGAWREGAGDGGQTGSDLRGGAAAPPDRRTSSSSRRSVGSRCPPRTISSPSSSAAGRQRQRSTVVTTSSSTPPSPFTLLPPSSTQPIAGAVSGKPPLELAPRGA
ncbi:unnamed protein product [Urochloa humidicola]